MRRMEQSPDGKRQEQSQNTTGDSFVKQAMNNPMSLISPTSRNPARVPTSSTTSVLRQWRRPEHHTSQETHGCQRVSRPVTSQPNGYLNFYTPTYGNNVSRAYSSINESSQSNSIGDYQSYGAVQPSVPAPTVPAFPARTYNDTPMYVHTHPSVQVPMPYSETNAGYAGNGTSVEVGGSNSVSLPPSEMRDYVQQVGSAPIYFNDLVNQNAYCRSSSLQKNQLPPSYSHCSVVTPYPINNRCNENQPYLAHSPPQHRNILATTNNNLNNVPFVPHNRLTDYPYLSNTVTQNYRADEYGVTHHHFNNSNYYFDKGAHNLRTPQQNIDTRYVQTQPAVRNITEPANNVNNCKRTTSITCPILEQRLNQQPDQRQYVTNNCCNQGYQCQTASTNRNLNNIHPSQQSLYLTQMSQMQSRLGTQDTRQQQQHLHHNTTITEINNNIVDSRKKSKTRKIEPKNAAQDHEKTNYDWGQHIHPDNYYTNSGCQQISTQQPPPRNISPRRTYQENMPVVVIPPQHAGLTPISNQNNYQHYMPAAYMQTGGCAHSMRQAFCPTSAVKYSNTPTYQDQSSSVRAPVINNSQNSNSTYRNFEANFRSRAEGSISLKEFLESWDDEEDIVANLPDLVMNIGHAALERTRTRQYSDQVEETCSSGGGAAGSGSSSEDEEACATQGNTVTFGTNEPLYILDSTNISSDALPQYKHIQQIDRLPDNIKGYYNKTLQTGENSEVLNLSLNRNKIEQHSTSVNDNDVSDGGKNSISPSSDKPNKGNSTQNISDEDDMPSVIVKCPNEKLRMRVATPYPRDNLNTYDGSSTEQERDGNKFKVKQVDSVHNNSNQKENDNSKRVENTTNETSDKNESSENIHTISIMNNESEHVQDSDKTKEYNHEKTSETVAQEITVDEENMSDKNRKKREDSKQLVLNDNLEFQTNKTNEEFNDQSSPINNTSVDCSKELIVSPDFELSSTNLNAKETDNMHNGATTLTETETPHDHSDKSSDSSSSSEIIGTQEQDESEIIGTQEQDESESSDSISNSSTELSSSTSQAKENDVKAPESSNEKIEGTTAQDADLAVLNDTDEYENVFLSFTKSSGDVSVDVVEFIEHTFIVTNRECHVNNVGNEIIIDSDEVDSLDNAIILEDVLTQTDAIQETENVEDGSLELGYDCDRDVILYDEEINDISFDKLANRELLINPENPRLYRGPSDPVINLDEITDTISKALASTAIKNKQAGHAFRNDETLESNNKTVSEVFSSDCTSSLPQAAASETSYSKDVSCVLETNLSQSTSNSDSPEALNTKKLVERTDQILVLADELVQHAKTVIKDPPNLNTPDLHANDASSITPKIEYKTKFNNLTDYTKHYIKTQLERSTSTVPEDIMTYIRNRISDGDNNKENNCDELSVDVLKNETCEKTETRETKKLKINLQDYRKRKLTFSNLSTPTCTAVTPTCSWRSNSSGTSSQLSPLCALTDSYSSISEILTDKLGKKSDDSQKNGNNSNPSMDVDNFAHTTETIESQSSSTRINTTKEIDDNQSLELLPKKKKKRFKNLHSAENEDISTELGKIASSNDTDNLPDSDVLIKVATQPKKSKDKHKKSSIKTTFGSKPSSSNADKNQEKTSTDSIDEKSDLKCHIKLRNLKTDKSKVIPDINKEYKVNKSSDSELKLTLKKQTKANLDNLDTSMITGNKRKLTVDDSTSSLDKPKKIKYHSTTPKADKIPKMLLVKQGEGYCPVQRDVSDDPKWQPVVLTRRCDDVTNSS